ncbi:MAG TPA: MFS transporter [Gemmatimonadaceae bacterium]|jgi:UMF1 family MFS transporter|nr:MFS transporter [Gemmatimonadaceae bacterium]
MRASLLARLGLERPELRAWAMYDWAVSSVQTTIMVAVFPIYFIEIARAALPGSLATQALATANTIAAIIVAIASPVLGAISDYAAVKKRMLAGAMAVGMLAVAGMFFVHHGDHTLALVLFVLSLVGATISVVMYEALLPHIARPEELDRVSSAGYALGYLGGGVLLAFNLLWILKPLWFGLPAGAGLSEAAATLPTRLAFLSVAAWWGVFSLPLFREVPEPPRVIESDETPSGSPLLIPLERLAETFRALRGFRHALIMLFAFMVYNDGIQTIQKMAAAYGAELGIGRDVLIMAILLVQFVGFPFAFLFGALAARISAKRAIFLGLLVYAGISVLGYFMRTGTHFVVLALLVATVQGGTQALSRSLFASLIPTHKSGEFFGFYSVFEKFASILGPLLFAVTVALTGSSRNAILSIILFFILGAMLLSRVDVAEGQLAARAAEQGALRPLASSESN